MNTYRGNEHEEKPTHNYEGKRPEWTALTISMGHFSVQMVTLDQVR